MDFSLLIWSSYLLNIVTLIDALQLYELQPRILSQDGHLMFIAAEHKNISLVTRGNGGIQVNGIDITQSAKISDSALAAMKKYQTNFDSSFEKISQFERLLDDGVLKKIMTLKDTGNTTDVPVNSDSVVRNVRRLNRRLNNLRRLVLRLTALLSKDDCESNPCHNGGTCQDLFDNYICHCPPQWEGPSCDKDVNECSRFAGTDLGCQNGATCINKPGSYECLCTNGWIGIHCTRRLKDCTQGSNAEICGHGTCVSQHSDVGYTCICDEGWTTDGRSPSCNSDVNECTMNKPPCSVNPSVPCVNLPGSFTCGVCPAGYTGTGFYCTDIDECANSNGGCSMNPTVQCINTLGSRICGSCPPGYSGDGTTCSYEGVCNVNNGGCHRLATCRNNRRIGDSFVQCICPVGYTGNGIGPNGCVLSATAAAAQDPCSSNPCRHGFCRANGTTQYTCECYFRFAGRNCDQLKNLCVPNPCQNGGTCTYIRGLPIKCRCPSGYIGITCDREIKVCGGQLIAESGTLTFPTGSYKVYDHTMSCAWNIQTNITKVLNITFTRFELETSPGCTYDWLQIHDGKNTLSRSFGRFCGNQFPNGGSIISTHNAVYLWFRSDHSVSSGGFDLTWSSVVPYCGDELKQITSHGTIQSPGSPGNYPNNRNCYWPLQAPPGKRIVFHFYTLMIGNNTKCDGDYLEFLTGTEATDPQFAKYCYSSHPSPLFSQGSEVLVHFYSDDNQTYPGFQITYSVVEGIPGCGGVYTRSRGEIRSPSTNGNYPNDVQCEYQIQLTEDSRVKLTFLSLDIESAGECQFDHVAIYAGSTVDAPLIGKYCGTQVPAPYITDDSKVLIVLRTDWTKSGSGFVLKYEAVCGERFSKPEGIIESPNYQDALDCIYEIIQPPGRIIKLEFSNLTAPSLSDPGTFVEVRDGHSENSTLLGRYGPRIPPLLVSTYNYMWIIFTTSGNYFKANYSTTDLGCGGLLKDKSGTFSSPSYPDVYPADTQCKWVILAPPGKVIQIIWMSFQLENSYNCGYDRVEVFDNNTETGQGSSTGRFCGSTLPPTFLSTSNMLTVVFAADANQHMGGFLASYNFVSENNVCGGNYYIDSGILKSPAYPQNYPLNIECTWTIQVQPGHQILLNITDFELENYSQCRYDFLEIRNGATAVSPALGTFCGTTIPKLIPSHANKMYIKFKSDMTKTLRGFKLTWQATATGCGGTLSSPTGSLISPNYPEPYSINAECTWLISVSTGSLIQVVFADLDMEEHSGCTMDYVELFDGPNINSKSLGKFCSERPAFIRSTTNNLFVKFRSDSSRNGRGFQLQYVTMCNNTVTGFRGVIESPNFPNTYMGSVNCNWEIEVSSQNGINISFSHFDLEIMSSAPVNTTNANRCIYDYVEILYVPPSSEYSEYEGEEPYEKYGVYCGTELPPLISLNANHAKIRFVTDNLLHGNGFRLEWQIEGCGEVLTKPKGYITSPNYPKVYPPTVECNWKIEVDYGNHIEITFSKIELEATYSCQLDYVKLYNGEDDTYPEIASLCHQDKPLTLRSSGNVMYVKFRADASVQGFGFAANYSTAPTKCGGQFVSNKGYIMSPNYPQNYDVNDTCGYLLTVNEGHVIYLLFEEFDLFSEENLNCSSNNNSYVKVYDGTTNQFPSLGKFCDRNGLNRSLTSSTHQLFVEMVTTTATTAKGFLASYKQACGARIESEDTGTIRLNANDLDYSEYNCTWTIIAKDPSKHVSLIITYLETIDAACDNSSRSLQVYNGESSSAPILGRYCGSKVPPTLTSDGSALHIDAEYNTVLYATYSIFDSHCGGTFTSLEGFLASPGYPRRYPIETECEWTIDIPEGNHVTLSFSYFQILQSEHCNTDYLEIRRNNGTGKLLGTFCGDQVPTNITNEGSLWIFLKTGSWEGDTSSITAKGFYAEYVLQHTNELTGISGRIVSPRHSRTFSFASDVTWKISVGYGKRIMLDFKEINLENADAFCYTWVKVYDGQDNSCVQIGEYCGPEVPSSIKSTSNILFIEFGGYSPSRSISRFVIDWTELDATIPPRAVKIVGCGSPEPYNMDVIRNATKIQSPGYPTGYAPNLKCEWVFTTVPMNGLQILFTDMDLQLNYGYTCYADYVEVFEKPRDSDWTSVVKTCKENITSRGNIKTTNMMKVVFSSNAAVNGSGFAATVRESCGGLLTEPTDLIVYDNDTRVRYGGYHRITCQWNITVRPGRTIQVEFLDLDIFNAKDNECTNYIIIRNGNFPDSPIMNDGKICGSRLPPLLNTTGNNAYIKFQGMQNMARFKIRYREVSSDCGSEIKLSQYDNVTEISSPNYPQIPKPYTECFWTVMAPPGETIRIDFPYRFDVSSASNCKQEYVEVRDGATEYSKLIGTFCGKKPNSQFSTDNTLYVKFFTQLTEPSNGFKASIHLAKCGGTIHGSEGRIQSPFFNQVSKYPNGANCTWHFVAPPGHTMDIKFNKIDLPDDVNCLYGSVWIYEENKARSGVTTVGRFCGRELPNKVSSSGDEVVVNFQTSKGQREHAGFSLKFNASREVCGGTIEASEGTITSPGYPLSHKTRIRCSWIIKVPKGRRVTMKIKDFDMPDRLVKTWIVGLVVYNDQYGGYIKKITAQVNEVKTCDNHAYLYYWSNEVTGRGFNIEFNSNEPSLCVGDLNQDSGIITQPNFNPWDCTYMRNKESHDTTFAMTITTTTNITKPGVKQNCNVLFGLIKSDEAKAIIKTVSCVPSTTTIKVPYSNVQVTLRYVSSIGQPNYTISYANYPCGGVITNESGNLKSPGYPEKYSKSLECSWLLRLPSEQTIVVTIEDLDLGEDCEKSYLDIYNGDSPTHPKIHRLCQSNKINSFQSQSNVLWIEYKYESSPGSKGFNIKYEPRIQGCGGVFHDLKRTIQSPGFPGDYPNNAECLWELRGGDGYTIGLTFQERFQIEKSDDCANDFLEIWDWRNEWFSLGRKCGRDFPSVINSTSDRMKILFRSNDKVTGKGFKASWEKNCGGTFTADKTERFIVSPGHPELYGKNLVCRYNISGGDYINIKFYEFELEGDRSNCKYDNLTVMNSYVGATRHMGKNVFCGSRLPPIMRLTGTVSIAFLTDNWVQKSGFKLSYQLDDCGANITSPTLIKGPEMGVARSNLFLGYLSCVWNITAPPRKIVVIRFQKFDLPYRLRCYYDNLEIYAGRSVVRNNRVANLCGNLNDNLPVIQVVNSSALITLRTDRSSPGSGFKAEVYFTDGPEAGCGGKINLTASQTITAPNLPDLDCAWTIDTSLSNTIKVHFDEFKLPMSCGMDNHKHSNCSCASLEIKDGHPDVAETIEQFCGISTTTFSRELTSTSSRIGIKFFSRGLNEKAFKVTVTPQRSICGVPNLTANKTIQTLTSPGYPNKYPSDVRCAWVIQSSAKYVVHFVDFDLSEDSPQLLINNECGEDRLEVLDASATYLLPDMNPGLTVSSNKKKTTDFVQYTDMTGTHQFCGKAQKPFDYYTNYNNFALKFFSGNNDRTRGRGFKLEYHTIDCHRNYTSLQGRITYTFVEDCYQLIEVPANYTISIFVQQFVLPSSNNCDQAGMEMRNGAATGPQLMKLCGFALPNPIFSFSNKVWIHTWKNVKNWYGSVSLSYTSSDKGRGCGGLLYGAKGFFTSPLYPLSYKNGTLCEWEVKVAVGMRVSVKFTVFDIQGECEMNYVKVITFDNQDRSEHKFCSTDVPAILYSSAHALVQYQSSTSNKGSGWSASYESVSK